MEGRKDKEGYGRQEGRVWKKWYGRKEGRKEGRGVQQDPLWRLDTDTRKEFRVCQGKLNHLIRGRAEGQDERRTIRGRTQG
jgi:hypothetical protein